MNKKKLVENGKKYHINLVENGKNGIFASSKY